MRTITDHIENWVSHHPFHAQLLAKGQINASALARDLKPSIQKQAGEIVSVESLIVALNRIKRSLPTSTAADYSQFIGDVSVQSNLAVLTVPQTGLDEGAFLHAIADLHKKQEYCLHTRGIWHTALIGSEETILKLTKLFAHSSIIEHGLVAVTIRLKPGHLEVPGVIAHILQMLAMSGVNLQETASSHDELTVIVKKESLSEALELLIYKDWASSRASSRS